MLTHGSLFADYESGMTQEEIAVKYDVSQKSVFMAMRRFGIKARKAAKRNQSGVNNGSWKGADAGYQALHIRVEVARGKPKKCEVCDTEKSNHYDWANLTGRFDDVNDYQRMCRSCHAKHDQKIQNIKKMRERCRKS